MAKSDVIAAIATPAGRGGVGIVRLSGADLSGLAAALTGRPLAPRRAAFRAFLDAGGQAIDEGIALYFAAPASYTGEDVLELQGHGGPAVMQLLLARCLQLGARLAEPGEFTRRAFLNGRLDLAQAEAVADLIDAATAQAAQSALRSLRGEFSGQVHALVKALIDLRVLLEGSLDFPDEGIDFLAEARVTERLQTLAADLAQLRARAGHGALLRDGLEVVLVGRPNVGKSSLLNRLAGYEAAIVTEVPGTTRDTVTQQIVIDGMPLHVVDTAGLRDTDDRVEQIGIARTHEAIGRAGLALLLVDASAGMTPADQAIRATLPAALPVLTVANKGDLAPAGGAPEADLTVSARTGAGLEALRTRIGELAGLRAAGEEPFMARARHLAALAVAAGHVDRALDVIGAGIELAAEELRLAQRALTAVTGEFGADDLLGEIFSRFCIGK